MRYWMIAVALAAVPAAAQNQASSWQYYTPEGGTVQAGVVNAQGAQLIVKCDKPGKGQVFAVVVTPEKQVPPSNQPFVTRALELRFDAAAPIEDRWRYYENSVVAIDQKPTIALTRFLSELADAAKFKIRTNPERARYVEAEFDVTGAREAIGRVYTSCQDTNPVTPAARSHTEFWIRTDAEGLWRNGAKRERYSAPLRSFTFPLCYPEPPNPTARSTTSSGQPSSPKPLREVISTPDGFRRASRASAARRSISIRR